MNVQTFVFGNPDGWKLYNKDQSEAGYFKSLYVNSRRGPRLMVHRRYDSSVVYVWLMYGIKEIIEKIEETGEIKGRGGIGHIGFAMILPDNNYIPEFRLVYSFFSDLFYRMLERADSPVGVNKPGEEQPYLYRIHKFDEAKPVMEWLRYNMPNVLKKTSLRSIADDSEFSSELSGRIATLSDEATDGEILNAFKRNSWVAISPEYRTKAAAVNAETTIELNLFDVTRLHTKLTGSILDWAIAGSTISSKQMDDMLAKINDARGLLAVYIKSITDESEIKEATHLQREFSTLRDKVEQLKIKQESLKVDTDDKVDRHPTDSAGRADDGHDSVADKPLPDFQHFKNMVLPYLPVGGVFLAIALFITALVKCSGGDAAEADADAGVDVVQTLGPHEKVDPDEFRKALEACRFNDAYEMLKGKSDSVTRTAYLKTKIDDYLWKLVKAGDGAYAITKFFLNLNNAEMCSALGFVDDDSNEIYNGASEWTARRENFRNLNELLAKDNPNESEYSQAVNLAKTLDKFDFTTELNVMKTKVQEAAQARNEPTAQSDRVNPGQSQVWTVTCDKDTRRAEGTVKNLGFDAFTNEEPITLTSNYKLSFESVAGVSVNTSDHKSFSLKSTTPVKFTMKYKRDGDVIGTVTITFKDR